MVRNENQKRGKSATKLNPFAIINSLSIGKPELMYDSQGNVNGQTLSAYIPFLINRSFSMHLSSLVEAQCMNRCFNLPKLMQYDFYRSALRKENRWGKKWPKVEDGEDLKAIIETYECSMKKAREIRSVLSNEQLKMLIRSQQKGGISK